MKREAVFHGLFLSLFVLALYQFFLLIEPFLTPLLGAMVLAIISFPVHRWVCRAIPRRNASLQAFLSTGVIVILIMIPFATLIGLLVNESANIVPLAQESAAQLRNWSQSQLHPWIDRMLPLARRS